TRFNFSTDGNGGNGGASNLAFGGAIADLAGDLTISTGTFGGAGTGNKVVGGAGGAGGNGGGFVSATASPVGTAGNGGGGGAAGTVSGGAIYTGGSVLNV